MSATQEAQSFSDLLLFYSDYPDGNNQKEQCCYFK